MQNTASNAAHKSTIRPGQSQQQSQISFIRDNASQLSKAAPASVSRSEAGYSADLSAVSNVAAQGEDPMDLTRHGGGSSTGAMMPELKYRPNEAEKWFQETNKNASTRGNVSFIDDDPPFHIPQQFNPALRHLSARTMSGTPGFNPPSLQHYQSIQSSSSGEFRSVIDDLTIENQKLRKRLRMLERAQAPQLHPDRMFEVRMPGLLGKDKQRLERLLKEFADSVSGSDVATQYKSTKKSSKKGSSNKPSSSSTLHSDPSAKVDSAYASGSTSAGNASGSQQDSRTMTSEMTSRRHMRAQSSSKDHKVRSYLQNISQGLLPQPQTVLSEKARTRKVVQRLEQLFTGRASTNSKNSQSAQQQEVSTAASNADMKASEDRGRPVQAEGMREANILPAEAEAAMLRNDAANARKENPSPARNSNQDGPDQRPTRPLDLDLNRAQSAADNIAYIRHLGFKPHNVINNEDHADEDGWIYLNLLMSMAQLHTINVTPGFVRQAVKDVSDKLELSADGSRVRWKGGSEGTRMSGDSSDSVASKNVSPEDPDMAGLRLHSPHRKRLGSDQALGAHKSSRTDDRPRTKSGSRDISASTDTPARSPVLGRRRPVFLGHIGREDSFQYEPMFSHGVGSDDGGDYFLNEDDSLLSSGLREDATASGNGSSRAKTPARAGTGCDDGPLIFYHRAKFVTDLSGDKGFTPVNNAVYFRGSQCVLGASTSVDTSMFYARKGIFSTPSPRVLDAMTYFPDGDVKVPEIEAGSTASSASSTEPAPHPLPVCGLGGITPADNLVFYATHLQSTRKRKSPVSDSGNRFRQRAKHVLTESLEGEYKLLGRIPTQDKLDVRLEGIGPVKHIELMPSELPPPNYVHMSMSSSNDDDSSSNGDESDGDDKLSGETSGDQIPDFAPPALMRTYEETNSMSEDSTEDDDEEMGDDDDDDEIDMLAHERALDAEEVAEREREWEEGLRGQSPDAKSSQATVGDRSFLSDEEGYASASGEIDRKRSVRAGSKRGRDEVEDRPQVPAAKRVETLRTTTKRE